MAASTAAMIWSVSVTSAWQNTPPISLASFSPLSCLAVEVGEHDVRPAGGQAAGGGAAEPEAPPVTMAEIPLRSMARMY